MRRVVQVEGIFRVPGGAESCAELEQELSASGKLGVTQYGDLRLGFASCDDVHSVATVLSRWLRSTNEQQPLLPEAMVRGQPRLSPANALVCA